MPLSTNPGDVLIWKLGRRGFPFGHAAIVWAGDSNLWQIEAADGKIMKSELGTGSQPNYVYKCDGSLLAGEAASVAHIWSMGKRSHLDPRQGSGPWRNRCRTSSIRPMDRGVERPRGRRNRPGAEDASRPREAPTPVRGLADGAPARDPRRSPSGRPWRRWRSMYCAWFTSGSVPPFALSNCALGNEGNLRVPLGRKASHPEP